MTSPPVECLTSPWRFHTTDQMREALEQYTDFQDGTLTRHYGDPLDRGEYDEDAMGDLEHNAFRRRTEIDRCMGILYALSPFYANLLHLYYCTGASTEHGGWLAAADRLGLRKVKCPALVRCAIPGVGDDRQDMTKCRAMVERMCNWDKEVFDFQLKEAVKRLMHVHSRRWDARKGAE